MRQSIAERQYFLRHSEGSSQLGVFNGYRLREDPFYIIIEGSAFDPGLDLQSVAKLRIQPYTCLDL